MQVKDVVVIRLEQEHHAGPETQSVQGRAVVVVEKERRKRVARGGPGDGLASLLQLQIQLGIVPAFC